MSPLKIKFKKDIDINRIPKAIEISRKFYFSDSEYQNSKTIWSIKLFAKSPRAQKFKEIEGGSEEWMFIVQVFRNRIPKICYFPTFLFDFPERIYLNFPPPSENSSVNDYYIRIIQDVLDTIGDDLSIKRHIIDRVESYDQENPWDFFDFIKSDTKKRIDHVMEIISDRITTTVFNLWDQIFHVDLSGKSISMNWGVDKPIENGLKPIYIEFFVKDGQSVYQISERSLRFWWFFCFLLFTQFRSSRNDSGAVFLFDEPASNLHAKAQEQLLKSFSTITEKRNTIIYSTHSHYMINPHWLENLFIVENKAIDYAEGIGGGGIARQIGTDINATRYRTFIGKNPDKTTYFEPILARLDYSPSKLELGDNSVIVEGKHDFYMFEYFRKIHFKETYNFHFIPGTGAHKHEPLLSLFIGWGLNFFVLCDDDKAGKAAISKYRSEWFLNEDTCGTLGNVVPDFKGKKLESLLDQDDKLQLASALGKKTLSKKDLSIIFQENLSVSKKISFSDATSKNLKLLFEALRTHFS